MDSLRLRQCLFILVCLIFFISTVTASTDHYNNGYPDIWLEPSTAYNWSAPYLSGSATAAACAANLGDGATASTAKVYSYSTGYFDPSLANPAGFRGLTGETAGAAYGYLAFNTATKKMVVKMFSCYEPGHNGDSNYAHQYYTYAGTSKDNIVPIPNFTATPLTGPSPLAVTLSGKVAGYFTSAKWFANDAVFSTDSGLTAWPFDNSKDYIVKFQATNPYTGTANSSSKTITPYYTYPVYIEDAITHEPIYNATLYATIEDVAYDFYLTDEAGYHFLDKVSDTYMIDGQTLILQGIKSGYENNGFSININENSNGEAQFITLFPLNYNSPLNEFAAVITVYDGYTSATWNGVNVNVNGIDKQTDSGTVVFTNLTAGNSYTATVTETGYNTVTHSFSGGSGETVYINIPIYIPEHQPAPTITTMPTPTYIAGFLQINVKDSVTGDDITSGVTINAIDTDSGYHLFDSPPFNNWSFSSNMLRYAFPGLHDQLITISKSGYYSWSDTVDVPTTHFIYLDPVYKAGDNSTTLVFHTAMNYNASALGGVSITVYNNTLGISQTKTTNSNGVVYFESMLCEPFNYYATYEGETNSGIINSNGYCGLISKDILFYNLIIPTTSIPPSSYMNIYVHGIDIDSPAQNSIYPIEVSIYQQNTGIWYNYTDSQYLPFGMEEHARLSCTVPTFYDIYVSATGYNTGSKLNYNLDCDGSGSVTVQVYLSKGNIEGNTAWYIGIKDADYGTPIKNASVSIWNAGGIIQIYPTVFTGDKGYVKFNLTNNSATYDVLATKSGYESGYVYDQYPTGETYYTEIQLKSLVTQYPTYPTYKVTALPTITNNPLYIDAGECRQTLDWDNETIWSPILNIEACAGIVNPVYQNHILQLFVMMFFGVFAFRISKENKLDSFILGCFIGALFGALTSLITYVTFIVLVIPLAAGYLLFKREAK